MAAALLWLAVVMAPAVVAATDGAAASGLSCFWNSELWHPFGDEDLRIAVVGWLTDRTTTEALYGPIGCWDTSLVTSFRGLFCVRQSWMDADPGFDVCHLMDVESSKHSADIGAWDTSGVTDMWSMFYNAYEFNSDIGAWDTSSVVDMSDMFHNAHAFRSTRGSSGSSTSGSAT